MVQVRFFEKPGCINNTKQKQLLKQSGHQLEVHDLLSYDWQAKELRSFFASLPVSQWFNTTAPAVRDGQIVPEQLNEDEAIALMLEHPLLIRRPLMQVGDVRRVGFDPAQVDAWIGLKSQEHDVDLESCPQKA